MNDLGLLPTCYLMGKSTHLYGHYNEHSPVCSLSYIHLLTDAKLFCSVSDRLNYIQVQARHIYKVNGNANRESIKDLLGGWLDTP